MMKLCEGPACAALVQQVCDRYTGSLDTVLRQKAQELQHLSQDAELRSRVMTRRGTLEPLEVRDTTAQSVRGQHTRSIGVVPNPGPQGTLSCMF